MARQGGIIGPGSDPTLTPSGTLGEAGYVEIETTFRGRIPLAILGLTGRAVGPPNAGIPPPGSTA
jgi:hypothetical protein